MFHRQQKVIAGIALAMVLAGCGGSNVNRSLNLAEGEQHQGNFSTVNGSIRLRADAAVDGSVRTVNGGVRLDERARAGDVKSVNGGIEIGDQAQTGALETTNGHLQVGEGARINGDMETVNGRIRIGNQVSVAGSVSTVNGPIEVGESEIEGQISNRNGNIDLLGDCRVGGGVHMRSRRESDQREPDVLTIGSGCEVVGEIVIERPAEVRAHESAVLGTVRGADVQRFE